MSEVEAIHIIIRYADREVETISAHEGLIDKHGAVWLGKIGKPLAQPKINIMNKQIANDIPTFVYLVQKVGQRYETHKGTIDEITRELPTQKNLIPRYYEQQNILQYVSLWLKISKLTKLDKNGLMRLKVANTGTAVPDALSTSMAGFFVVKEGRGMHI